MNADVLTSISEVAAAAWNAVVGRNRLICRHEYLQAVENSRINDCRYFYPVVYEDGVLVAHSCVYFISTELDTFARGRVKDAIQCVRRAWGDFLIMRTMECGSPVGLGSTVCIRDGVDAKAALRLIVREVERLARQQRVSAIFFRDFTDGDLSLFDELQTAGYRRVKNLPCARLPLRWTSFDAYLNDMRSPYRCKLVAQMKKFRAAGGTVEWMEDAAGSAGELARLWRNAYDHAQEYRREVLQADYFENVARLPGGCSGVLQAKVNGRSAGFLLLLLDDDVLTTLFSGLDYAYSRDSGAYFNLFYEAVRLAIDRGLHEIDFGITCLSPKLDLGATVVPLHMYMKYRNPIGHRVVPGLFEKMSPAGNFAPRNVFKT
jgi:predicted N-acyltransferase